MRECEQWPAAYLTRKHRGLTECELSASFCMIAGSTLRNLKTWSEDMAGGKTGVHFARQLWQSTSRRCASSHPLKEIVSPAVYKQCCDKIVSPAVYSQCCDSVSLSKCCKNSTSATSCCFHLTTVLIERQRECTC
jgi:hypothetical protein